jgi:tRNA 2-thiouridine synthesizing protein A
MGDPLPFWATDRRTKMARQGEDPFEDEDALAAQPTALLHELSQLTGRGCAGCAHRLCGHEALFSVVLGLKDAPRCLTCLAAGLNRSATELRDQLLEHIQHRDCYRQAWQAASEWEGLRSGPHPACLWPADGGVATATGQPSGPARRSPPPQEQTIVVWDAGDMSCGDLVLALRLRLESLSAGALLEVIAHDPAAREDLPAWCRMTDNRLLSATHPRYLIQRKET